MKKWIAAILIMTLLTQVLPWTAIADAVAEGQIINENELRRALQIAGLQVSSDGAGSGALLGAESSASADVPFRLEAKESEYHEGMEPSSVWNAGMLIDWLDDKLSKDLHHITDVYTRADSLLGRMKTDNPGAYARLTQGSGNAGFAARCRDSMLAAEEIEERIRFLRDAIYEETTLIESNAELLFANGDTLFAGEKARLSAQLREATEHLAELRGEVVALMDQEMKRSTSLQGALEGEDNFSQWLDEVLSSEEGVERSSLSASAVQVAEGNTRKSRLLSGGRVLSGGNGQDVNVLVINKNQFAIEFHGVDNQPVGGVKVTVTDLNGKTVETKTSDEAHGSVLFDANNYVNDFDYTMELSIEVDAEDRGYRSFSIPWVLMTRGEVRRESLVLLTGPETKENRAEGTKEEKESLARESLAAGEVVPYISVCLFNKLDIMREVMTTYISPLNDADLDFTVTVVHGAKEDPGDPVLHYKYYDIEERKTGRGEMKPTKKIIRSDTETDYIYTRKWKQYLEPDISLEDRPYFVIPSTNEVFRTKLNPVRSLVDSPVVTGQESVNPFNTVFTKGVGTDVELPKIGGRLNFNLPFDKYLPKINCNPLGYITVTWGSSLVDPKTPIGWKDTEAKAYDRAMKRFEHETSIAKKMQATGTASNFYKGIFQDKGIVRLKLDCGFFVMGSGRAQVDEDKVILWGMSAMAGFEIVGSFDYTQMMQIGIVPMYFNFNFSASAGIGLDGIHVTWKIDPRQKPIEARFEPISNITVNLRLKLTVTLGIGIKGLCSVWVAASGGLNFIISLNISAPQRLMVLYDVSVSVGFEIFWIRYSKVLWTLPSTPIVNKALNSFAPNPSGGTLFDAYTLREETTQADVVPQEPARYPVLAPQAETMYTRNLGDNVNVVRYRGYDYCFDNAWYEYTSETLKLLNIRNLNKNVSRTAHYFIEQQFLGTEHINPDPYSIYGYDVYSDGTRLHLVMTMAKSFDEDKHPVPGGTWEDPNIVLTYVEFEGISPENDFPQLKKVMVYRWIPDESNALSPICSNPHIEGVQIMDGKPIVFGNVYGQSDYHNRSQYNNFAIEPEDSSFVVYGDMTVEGQIHHRRVAMNTSLRNWVNAGAKYNPKALPNGGYNVPSLGFITLEQPREGRSGDSFLQVYEYYQNRGETQVRWYDNHDHLFVSGRRRPVTLLKGQIAAYEVMQMSDGHSDPSQTIFYTLKETAQNREAYRLKGIYLSPREFVGWDEQNYEVTYSDYDLTLPTPDFESATIGVSQYLYWLSAVSPQEDSKVDTWRISGVYYDQFTQSMSDELVIAEFTLPELEHNGRRYPAVPEKISLTDAGVGYITAAPNVNEEQHDLLERSLFRFPITLKAHLTMQRAALMETTVVQGDFVHTDFSMMNDSNMGIASFDVDVILLKNGVEQQCVETLHGDLLMPENSRVVLHGDGDVTVATGEHALYRNKNFTYSPKQHDWLVESSTYALSFNGSSTEMTRKGELTTNHVVTNVMVPGVLGGYAGSIKIPENWEGEYQLRLKVTNYSTYTNWLAASALAKSNPALFRESALRAGNAQSNLDTLQKAGVVRLDYKLNEDSGKMELQNQPMLLAGSGDRANLYALEVDAPDSVDINCEVQDLQVDHRVWDDYYGEKMLDITLHNYYQDNQSMELTCAMYLDDSATPVYVSLPYYPDSLSADKTTTISLPLSTLFDPAEIRSARFVFTPRNVTETATLNNEFTIYPAGRAKLHFTHEIQGEILRGGETLIFDKTIPATEGETVTLSVGVDGGTRPYQIQWQYYDSAAGKWIRIADEENIQGANTDTLTLKNVTGSWNGRQVRCVVTDAQDSAITSESISLLVSQVSVPVLPDTGDTLNLPLYLGLAALALVALILVGRIRRKKKD